jgi:hypothetical protein
VLGEAGGVDRGAGDDHLQVGTLREQLPEVAEDEVDVEAALVGLVDDQRVVATQHPVALDLGEQDAVGHHLDERRLADLVGEAHRVADVVAQLRPDLLGHPLGDRAGGDPAGLGVADHPVDAAAGSRHSFGSWVLLPDPVSPATITTWWSRIAARSSSRRSVIGKLSGYASRPRIARAATARGCSVVVVIAVPTAKPRSSTRPSHPGVR